MKLQYLGDSKDAFKWDYLDFLAREMRTKSLHYVAMWTRDDGTSHGLTDFEEFPAPRIWNFCCALRSAQQNRDDACHKIRKVPELASGNRYVLQMHKENEWFRHAARGDYFSGMDLKEKQILFFDPDVGFEPKSPSKKHICYSDIASVWEQVKDDELESDALLMVFQHARREKSYSFRAHYATIKAGLSKHDSFESTALFWCDKVMFIAIGSRAQIDKVRAANVKYQKQPRPVQALDENRK